MTKREYFESQGFHAFNPAFVADEEADEAFIEFVNEVKEILAEELEQKHERLINRQSECTKHQNCQNCGHNLKLERWDYTQVRTGNWKEKCEGYVCTAFADEGIAIWKIGADDGMCEMWTERKTHERTDVQTGR